MKRKILGIEQGINKKYNTPFTVLHTVTEFDDYARNNRNAKGHKCEVTYIRSTLEGLSIGDVVDFVYQPGFNNEAVVSGVNLIEKAK